MSKLMSRVNFSRTMCRGVLTGWRVGHRAKPERLGVETHGSDKPSRRRIYLSARFRLRGGVETVGGMETNPSRSTVSVYSYLLYDVDYHVDKRRFGWL